jgi:hypothetical protein
VRSADVAKLAKFEAKNISDFSVMYLEFGSMYYRSVEEPVHSRSELATFPRIKKRVTILENNANIGLASPV